MCLCAFAIVCACVWVCACNPIQALPLTLFSHHARCDPLLFSVREMQKGDEVAWYAEGDAIVRSEYNPAIAYGFGNYLKCLSLYHIYKLNVHVLMRSKGISYRRFFDTVE